MASRSDKEAASILQQMSIASSLRIMDCALPAFDKKVDAILSPHDITKKGWNSIGIIVASSFLSFTIYPIRIHQYAMGRI